MYVLVRYAKSNQPIFTKFDVWKGGTRAKEETMLDFGDKPRTLKF